MTPKSETALSTAAGVVLALLVIVLLVAALRYAHTSEQRRSDQRVAEMTCAMLGYELYTDHFDRCVEAQR